MRLPMASRDGQTLGSVGKRQVVGQDLSGTREGSACWALPWTHYTGDMCGRFTLADLDWLSDFLGIPFFSDEPFTPRYNVAPSQEIPVVLNAADGLTLRPMTWGFRPGWLKVSAKQPAPINA